MTTFDPRAYLTDEFPRSLQSQVSPGSRLVLQVLVPGRHDCRMHYVVEAGAVEARPGFAASPDLTLTIQTPELERLARGELDVKEALILDRIRIFGDRTKLSLLSGSVGLDPVGA